MGVVEVSPKIAIVADRVLPVAPLPDAALAAPGHDGRSRFVAGQRFRESDLDCAPPAGEVGIAFRQGPQAVHVVGQDDPGVDAERCAGTHLSNGLVQDVDLHHQEMRVAVTKVHGEEEGSTRNPITAIVRHPRIMLSIGSRRNALPLFRPTLAAAGKILADVASVTPPKKSRHVRNRNQDAASRRTPRTLIGTAGIVAAFL
jgi:hypothetical protein